MYLRISESKSVFMEAYSPRAAASFSRIASRSLAMRASTSAIARSRPRTWSLSAVMSLSYVRFSSAISRSARSLSASYDAAFPAKTESCSFFFLSTAISRPSARMRVS